MIWDLLLWHMDSLVVLLRLQQTSVVAPRFVGS